MSLEEFIVETLEGNGEEVDDLAKLKEILDQLPEGQRTVYFASITSNL